MSKLFVELLRVDSKVPSKSTTHAAAFDVCANLNTPDKVKVYSVENTKFEQNTMDEPVRLNPGDRALIPTGVKITCEIGYCVKVYARSGWATKRGITLSNCVGIIDVDYRGELFVSVINQTIEPQIINHDDRIAQIMVEKVDNTILKLVSKLPPIETNRVGGIGSTGYDA